MRQTILKPSILDKVGALSKAIKKSLGLLFVCSLFQSLFIGGAIWSLVYGEYVATAGAIFFSVFFGYFMGGMVFGSLGTDMNQYYFREFSVSLNARLFEKETHHNEDSGADDYTIGYSYIVDGSEHKGYTYVSHRCFEKLEEGVSIPIYYLSFDPSESKFRDRKFMKG